MADILIMGITAALCCAGSYIWLDYYGFNNREAGRIAIELVIMTAVVMFVIYCLMVVMLDMVSLRMLYAAG